MTPLEEAQMYGALLILQELKDATEEAREAARAITKASPMMSSQAMKAMAEAVERPFEFFLNSINDRIEVIEKVMKEHTDTPVQ